MAVILNASTSSGFVQSADTSGEINLQSNGSTKLSVLSTGVSGTLVQGTAVASTSGTSIDFTGIPSWVKRITVMFAGVSTNGSSIICVQLGDSGGIETTGYSGGGTNQTPTYVTNTVGLNLVGSSAAVSSYIGHAILTNLSGNTWVLSAGIQLGSSNMAAAAGAKTLSDTLDRIRITTINGTDAFDAGTINIQYEG
jgi:hypothetical protein